jgi:ribosome-associated protein
MLTVGRYEIPDAELGWRFSRSSGPGGQGVNTTDSRVELTFDLGASTVFPLWLKDRAAQRLGGRLVEGRITITSSEQRSQLRNREAALARLGALLSHATAPPAPPRRPTRPGRRAVERRITAKKQRGETKRLRSRPTD